MSIGRTNLLWRCERKRGVLRRIARDISSLFRPKSVRYGGFAALWIPSNDALLTSNEFQFVDRKIAEEIARNPEKLFSINPRYFEDLMASVYADLDYEVKLTKRTRDGGRDVIALKGLPYAQSAN